MYAPKKAFYLLSFGAIEFLLAQVILVTVLGYKTDTPLWLAMLCLVMSVIPLMEMLTGKNLAQVQKESKVPDEPTDLGFWLMCIAGAILGVFVLCCGWYQFFFGLR